MLIDSARSYKSQHNSIINVKKEFEHASCILIVINSIPAKIVKALLLILAILLPALTLSITATVTDSSYEDALNPVLFTIFFLLSLELMLRCYAEVGFLWKVEFFVDLASNLLILFYIPDITTYFLDNYLSYEPLLTVIACKFALLGSEFSKKIKPSDTITTQTLPETKRTAELLSSAIILRICILILVLIVFVSLLRYQPQDHSVAVWLSAIKVIAKNETVNQNEIHNIARKFSNFYKEKDIKLAQLRIESPWLQPTFNQTFEDNIDFILSNFKQTTTSLYYVANTTLQLNGFQWNSNQYLYNSNDFDYEVRVGYTPFVVRATMDLATEINLIHQGILYVLLIISVFLFIFTVSLINYSTIRVVAPFNDATLHLRHNVKMMLQTINSIKSAAAGKNKLKNVYDIDNALNSARSTDSKRKSHRYNQIVIKPSRFSEDGNDIFENFDQILESTLLQQLVDKLVYLVNFAMPTALISENDEVLDRSTIRWLRGISRKTEYNSFSTLRPSNSTWVTESSDETAEKEHFLTMMNSQDIPSDDVLYSCHFDVLEHSTNKLQIIIIGLLMRLNIMDDLGIPISKLQFFLKDIASKYISTNPYHHFQHGCDVFHTTYLMMTKTFLLKDFSSIDTFSLFIAAIAHDVGHLGVNNLFLVKSNHALAIQHNDRSPLENMHCNIVFEVIRKKSSNIFINLSEAEYQDARTLIITAILGTDMSHHFETVLQAQVLYDGHEKDSIMYYHRKIPILKYLEISENKLFVAKLLLHSADVSNPTKPFKIFKKWTDLVIEEFCLQGDKERMMGIEISPMCDRQMVNVCNAQMAFIEFIVAPLFQVLIHLYPGLLSMGESLLENYVHFYDMKKLEIQGNESVVDKTEELQLLDEKYLKFEDKMNYLRVLKESIEVYGMGLTSFASSHGHSKGHELSNELSLLDVQEIEIDLSSHHPFVTDV